MKRMKSLLSLMLALAVALTVIVDVPAVAYAEEAEEPAIIENDLPLDTWKSSAFTKNGVEWWKVTMTSYGWLNVKVQGIGAARGAAEIWDADKTQMIGSSEYWSYASASNPKTITFKKAFKPGTYWVKAYAREGSSGSYKIWANVDKRTVTTVAGNETLDSPQTSALNTTHTGFFSVYDEVDIFKVYVPTATKLHFTLRTTESSYGYMELTIYDSNYEEVSNTHHYYSGNKPDSWDTGVVLKPAYYYIKLNNRDSYKGGYSFYMGQKTSVASVTVKGKKSTVDSGKKIQLTAVVSPSNAANKDVKWSSSDSWVASVDSSGLVTAATNRCGLVTISATSKDNDSIVGQYKLYVLPGKVSLNYAYNYSWYKRKMYVSFSSCYGAAGYQVQYSTDKKFNHVKTKVFKTTYGYLKGLVKGKNYYVRVRPMIHVSGKKKYGPWSNVKKCRIKG